MPKLIDIEKIKPMDFPSTEMDGLDVVRYLNTLPTVDAVEVVRCKDCRFLEMHSYRCDPDNKWPCCKILKRKVKENDFCSHGERKDNG